MPLLIGKIALQILAVVIAMLVNKLDYVAHDKRTTKFKSGRKWLFILSGCFLAFSIVVTVIDGVRSTEKEKELKAQLEKVQGQNDGLQKTLSILGEDQKSRFSSLFEEQQRVGTETATQIQGSANFLRGRIEESLSLLNRSAKDINRANNPINDITISFQLSTQLDKPPGIAYRNRVEKNISELSKQVDGLWAMGTVMGNGNAVQRIGITNSPYTPDKDKEPLVYSAINFVGLTIEFYKQPAPIKTLIANQSNSADLRIRVRGSLDNSLPTRDSYQGSHLLLIYELKDKSFTINAGNLKPVPYAQHNTGKIIAVPDLSGSQMVVRIGGFLVTDKPSIKDGIIEIYKSVEMTNLTIRMSGGREFNINRTDLRQYADQVGQLFYVYEFPKDL